jgi:hypothetical protein
MRLPQEHASPSKPKCPTRLQQLVVAAILLAAASIRFSYLFPVAWEAPYEPNHPDENILSYEAVAAWQGVAPQEIGWPAATYRAMLSVTYAASAAPTILSGRITFCDCASRLERWTSDRLDDPAIFYQLGRATSAIIGVLFVWSVYVVVARRETPRAGIVSAIFATICPLAVDYSQFILADMLGALFCMCSLAIRYDGTPRDLKRIIAVGISLGLATATKHFFALWILPATVHLWIGSRNHTGTLSIVKRVGTLLAGVLITYLLLVPYCFTNPMLYAKEFMNVVGIKITGNGVETNAFLNLRIVFSHIGVGTWAIAAIGLISSSRNDLFRRADVLIGVFVSLMILMKAGIVFERYAMLFLPGLLYFCGCAFERALTWKPNIRWLGTAAFVIAFASIGMETVRSQFTVGRRRVDGLVRDWVMTNIPSGSRIIVNEYFAARLPRTPGCIQYYLAYYTDRSAYFRKLATNGIKCDLRSQPFQSAVLNDEQLTAFWLRQEFVSTRERAYWVDIWSPEVRFRSMPLEEALDQESAVALAADAPHTYLISSSRIDNPRLDFVIEQNSNARLIIYRVRNPESSSQGG